MEKTHTHTVSRAAGALVVAAALMPVASFAQGELSFEEIAKREKLRRGDAVKNGDALILEAREAYKKKDYKVSVTAYNRALGQLPNGRIFDERRAFLNESLVAASIAMSKTLTRDGDIATAKSTLENVLKVDPNNQKAEVELDNLYDPIRTNPSATQELAAKVDKVRRHLYKGEGFYNLGQYDQANEEFDSVLRLDAYNQAARRWQTKLHNEKRDYFRSAFDETRARLLSEVDRAWEIIPRPVSPIDGPGTGRGEGVALEPGVISQQRKLSSIIIPRIDLENATLETAIQRLEQIVRDNDPETDVKRKGLSFVIRRQMGAGGADGEAIEANEIRIPKLSLQNVPAAEVLRQICLLCDPPMRYKVEEYVVAIVEADDTVMSEIYSKSFVVPPDFIERIGSGSSGGNNGGGGEDLFGGGGDDAEAAPPSLKELFEGMGVPFKGKSNVKFIPATSVLFVSNTAVGLDKIAKIIEDIQTQVPKQISITAKFVEINQQDNDELGFDWIISPFGLTGNSMFLGGGNVGNGTGRDATNFASPINNTPIPGVPGSGNVFNTPTSGLRSGDTAITRDSINFFLNNPTRTAQSASVAPGILSLTGIFSDGQVQMIMRGLAQKKGTDIMNAPTVLARPGETARIEVVRQFIYPTEYDPPEIPDNIGGGGGNGNNGNNGGGGGGGANQFQVVPITPATPTAFEERPTGVILEVEPKLGNGADRRTISLDLEPEIVEFEGFINYGSPIQALAVDALGNPVQITVTENRIEMPVFSKRSVKTGLTIFDGHTVAVGGLMSEEVQKVEDKVPILGDIPLLGRLFQSHSENRIKSNLVIFVTANIIDATGKKLYQNDNQIAADGSNSASSMIVPDLFPTRQLQLLNVFSRAQMSYAHLGFFVLGDEVI